MQADSDSESRRRSEWGNHFGKPSDSDYLQRLYAPALINKGHSLCRLSESASETESACTVCVPLRSSAVFHSPMLCVYLNTFGSLFFGNIKILAGKFMNVNTILWVTYKRDGYWTRVHNWETRLSSSSCLSVCPSFRPYAWAKSASTGRISMTFVIWVFCENLSRKFKFHWNLTRITGTLREDLRTSYVYWTVHHCNSWRTKDQQELKD